MKRALLLSLVAATFLIDGCSALSGSDDSIDYIPAKWGEKEDWGFVDNKGNAVCTDQFKETPSIVVEGIFSVEESEGISLYSFDKKKHKLIIDGLKSAGKPCDGLIPVCRKDSKIEIVDLKGKTVFEIPSQIDGKVVVSCNDRFQRGYLIVNLSDSDGENKQCLLDKSGKVILKPEYNSIDIVSDNLFLCTTADKQTFVNAKKEAQKQFKLDEESEVFLAGEYVIIVKDQRNYIYNLKGKMILKCPEYVKYIVSIEGKNLIYRGENGYGALNLKGEKIFSDKYEEFAFIKDGKFYVCKDDDHKAEILNKKGEKEFTTEFDNLANLPGFGVVGITESDRHERYSIIDKEGNALSNDEMYDVSPYMDASFLKNEVRSCGDRNAYSTVENDFFDVNAIISTVESLLESGLRGKGYYIGNNLGNIPELQNINIDAFASYESSFSQTIMYARRYSIYSNISFDGRIKAPVYGSVPYQEWDWWYGRYYTSYRTEITGYKKNETAKIKSIDLSINVDPDKIGTVWSKLTSSLQNKYPASDNDTYDINGNTVEVMDNGYEIKIIVK